MPEDPRNCGTIACIINAEGYCWCGLKWDGQKMSRVPMPPLTAAAPAKAPARKTAGSTAKKTAVKKK
jgi:hypothetical protein